MQVHPIFMLSIADFILGILWTVGGGLWLSEGYHRYRNGCFAILLTTVVSFILQYCDNEDRALFYVYIYDINVFMHMPLHRYIICIMYTYTQLTTQSQFYKNCHLLFGVL